MPMSLEDVIARLQAATEGGRELDAAIEITTRGLRQTEVFILAKGGDVVILRRTVPPYITLTADFPHYTTSLDAALTLLPEGCALHIAIARHATPHTAACVDVRRCTPDDDELLGQGDKNGPVVALAMCIAVLRAKATAP